MITYERRLTIDFYTGASIQHRWCCSACPRRGVWLVDESAAKRNGELHARMHVQQQEDVAHG
ncbi:MAG: hypothetical protein ACTHU0_27105 [Kofleriaceae bacterium]